MSRAVSKERVGILAPKSRSPEEKRERVRKGTEFFDEVEKLLAGKGKVERSGSMLTFEVGRGRERSWSVADLDYDTWKVTVRNQYDQKKKVVFDPRRVADHLVGMLEYQVPKEANFRAQVIRLAHEKPELRPYLLSILKKAAADPLDIRDKESGKTYDELKKEMDETLEALYKEHASTGYSSKSLSDRIQQYQKDMGGRLERLRVRIEKAKRGLRLSTNPKDMAKKPARGDWGYEAGKKVSAIVSSEGVVGWMVEGARKVPLLVPGKSYSYGHQVVPEFVPYDLEGKKLPGVTPSKTANRALDDFSDWMKKALYKTGGELPEEVREAKRSPYENAAKAALAAMEKYRRTGTDEAREDARRAAEHAAERATAEGRENDAKAHLEAAKRRLEKRASVERRGAELPRLLLKDRNAIHLLGQLLKGNTRIFAMDARPPGWVLLERLGLAEKDPERAPKGNHARLTEYGKTVVDSLPKPAISG